MAKDFQPLLFPESWIKSFERKTNGGPLALITFDATPSYDQSRQVEQFRVMFPEINNLNFSLPNRQPTPLDLIQDHDSTFILYQTGDALQRSVEASCSTPRNSIHTNILFNSHISALAWTLFSRENRQIDSVDARSSITFSKVHMERFHKALLKLEIHHIVRLIRPDSYTEAELHHFSADQIVKLRSNIETFNLCLLEASKTFTRLTGSEIEYIH